MTHIGTKELCVSLIFSSEYDISWIYKCVPQMDMQNMDIFFVEANASFEAASARSVVTKAAREAAQKERTLGRPREALATFHQHYPASKAKSVLRTGTAPPLRIWRPPAA